jgi:hypothetical protein
MKKNRYDTALYNAFKSETKSRVKFTESQNQ